MCYNKAVVILCNSAADSQPDAGARVFTFAMQPVKHLKYFFSIFRFETYTIVFNTDLAIFLVSLCHFAFNVFSGNNITTDLYMRRGIRLLKFQRVAYKVFQQLFKLVRNN